MLINFNNYHRNIHDLISLGKNKDTTGRSKVITNNFPKLHSLTTIKYHNSSPLNHNVVLKRGTMYR